MTLERDELERDLVTRDKQSLISDCLRLFDTNTQLADLVKQQDTMIDRLKDENQGLKGELEELEGLKWWELIGCGIGELLKR